MVVWWGWGCVFHFLELKKHKVSSLLGSSLCGYDYICSSFFLRTCIRETWLFFTGPSKDLCLLRQLPLSAHLLSTPVLTHMGQQIPALPSFLPFFLKSLIINHSESKRDNSNNKGRSLKVLIILLNSFPF
jgi:hypothetical protein